MTSAPVLERAGRTEEAARVAKLFERHGRMVYGVCRAMLRDAHEAEDATQQTFLSAHRSLLGGARVRDDGAWLATIARNECRARIGSGMRAPLPVAGADLEAIPTVIDETERSAQAEELRSAIAELPARQREAVVLRHLYGLSYGEVATALGLSRPATEALLFRARRAMKLRLRPAVVTAIAVPLSVQEGLAQAIPGFGAASAGGVVAGAAGGGLLAKLAAGPVGVKVVTATVAVTTVGAVGTVDSERAGRDRAERAAVVTTVGARAGQADSSGVGQSGEGRSGSSAEDDESGKSRPGADDGRDDSDDGGNSGRGSSSAEPSSDDDDRVVEDDSLSSGSGRDDDSSGPSGSSSDDETSGSGSGHGDESDSSGPGDSSGADSSGAGSSGSGSRSGEDSSGDAAETDSSGHGSGDGDGDSGSSGSGKSGSGSSGSGDDDQKDDPDD